MDMRFRIRVERLLRRNFRTDDLKTLLLYARDRCDGKESVQEVGDFIAHHDERKKGILTSSTRDWFLTARFMAPRFAPGALPFDEGRLSSSAPEYLRAAFRRKPPLTLRQQSGLSVANGRRVLERLLKRLELNPDGTYRVSRFIPTDEIKLLRALCSSLDVRYVFEADRLFRDFCETLRSNDLISKKEIPDLAYLETPLALLAISMMHNNNIVMLDGTSVKLRTTLNPSEGLIQVFAGVPVEQLGFAGNLQIAAPMFGTRFDPYRFCDPVLIDSPEWDFEIELRDDMKLYPIV